MGKTSKQFFKKPTDSSKIKGKNSSVPQKYEWEVYSDNNLRLWTSGSKVEYFIYKQRAAVKPDSGWGRLGSSLSMPKYSRFNPWRKLGVDIVGYARHADGYYHSRVNESFYDFLLVKSGVLVAKFSGKTVKLNPSEVLIIPPKRLCDNFVESGGAELYWAHMLKIPRWEKIFGREVFIKKFDSAGEIFALMEAYRAEAYSAACSPAILGPIAECIAALILREFPHVRAGVCDIEKIAAKVNKAPGRAWRISEIAKSLEMSARTFDKHFEKIFARTFSKYVLDARMGLAADILRSKNCTNAEVAEIVGYANASSFSKAFFAYYGVYPGKMMDSFPLS